MRSTAFASVDEIAGWLARARSESKKGSSTGLMEAERLCLDSIEALSKITGGSSRDKLAEAQLALGMTQYKLAKYKEALRATEDAERTYREIGAAKPSTGLCETLKLMAECLFALAKAKAEKRMSIGDRIRRKDEGETAESYFQRAFLTQSEAIRLQSGFLDNATRVFGELNSRLPEQDRLYHSPHTSPAPGRAVVDTKEHALPPVPTEKELVAALDEHAIGQHAAKAMLAYVCREHIRRLHRRPEERRANEGKLNFFLYGPTGCGKTLMLSCLSAQLGVPVFLADATNLTASGYRGGDIENIFHQLLVQCNWNVSLAQRAIVLIDEIDKKAKSDSGIDIGGAKIQHELLPILQGTRLRINKNGSGSVSLRQDDFVELDTSDMLFGVAGAFSGLEEILESESTVPGIGFSATLKGKAVVDFSKARAEDFVKFGILPELLGRLPIRCHIQKLNREELRDTLTEPTNSLVEQFHKQAEHDFELRFTEDALDAIVAEALSMSTNARALNSVMHECLRAVKEVPETKPGVRIITAEVVTNREQLLAKGAASVKRKRRRHDFITSEKEIEAEANGARGSMLSRLARAVNGEAVA